MPSILRDHRCQKCEKLLLRGMLFSGTVKIKCSRCKTENIFYGINGQIQTEGTYSILFDYEGKIIDTDEGATRILGYPKEELIGMHREQLHSDVSSEDYPVLRRILPDLGSVAFDTVHQKKDGEIIPVKLRIRVLASEGGQFALITGRPLPKSRDRAGKKKIQAYQFSINLRGQLIYVSIPTATLLGHRWITLLGKPMTDFFEAVLPEDKQFSEQENVRIRNDQGQMFSRLAFNPIDDGRGDVIGYDITGFLSDA